MLDHILKYYHTLKYLKWIQIRYQLWYRLTSIIPFFNNFKKQKIQIAKANDLVFDGFISSPTTWYGDDQYQFLNIRHQFENGVDWNYSAHGKLWTYNLNYFDFLEQAHISKFEGLALIYSFIGNEKNIKDGMESFPISLRMIFWTKFLIKNKIKDDQIEHSMYHQLQRLLSKPEYHLMGNHLLENGFGLLFGGVFFKDKKMLAQADEIITKQLREQILLDGAHFELSPMYHQIMLYRILDSINLLQNNPNASTSDLLKTLQAQASLMLGWMKNITFTSGDMPCINDSTNGIAPKVKTLFDYAKHLQIDINQKPLSDSGYRIFSNEKIEVLMDVGKIGPDYIPGHAHSDTFNFILQYRNAPFIVDTGISTYEKNERRNLERSTASHNTVMIDEKEQSEIWGGFRVGRRAKVSIIEETKSTISATHDGYKKIGCQHQRTFSLKENQFQIDDLITGGGACVAFIHFHPDVKVVLENQKIIGTFGEIEFDGSEVISLENYLFAEGFNQTKKALKVKVTFKNNLHTNINFL